MSQRQVRRNPHFLARLLLLACCLATPLAVWGQTAPPPGGGGGGGGMGRGVADDDDDESRRPAAARAQSGRGPGGAPEIVVLARPGNVPAVAAAMSDTGARLLRRRPLGAFGRTLLVFEAGAGSLAEMRAAVAAVDEGAAADRNHFYRFAGPRPRLYAPAMVGAEDSSCRLGGTKVGLIDGPVDRSHPALARVKLAQGSVLLAREEPAGRAHGTAVAALIAGEDVEGGFAGFAPGARLYAVSAFARERDGPAADVEKLAAALDVLARSGVRLVNLSLAGPRNDVFASILEEAERRGMILVAAVGNDGRAKATLPAAAPGVIGVTAVDPRGRRYRRANMGPFVDFAAPGVDLWVARPGGGGYVSGTSYAAPIVTAFVARLMDQGLADGDAIARALARLSRDLGPKGRDQHTGWGLVQAPPC